MRIAVLSDIHSNLVALDAVLAEAGPIDAAWVLGDIVGYGPEPDAVVERLRGIGATGVLGNHDAAALGGPEIDWFNPDARAAAAWTRDTISEATRAWLSGLPVTATQQGFALVHGSPRDPLREYIADADVARDNLAELDVPIGLHGHTHVPAAWLESGQRIALVEPHAGESLRLADRRGLLNPGSVGQPRDGDPRAAYAILDLAAGTMTWQRAAYDVPQVQAAMRAVGLPLRLIDRLARGQ
jgi:diadenosine tetraphosphatase ApaH/serine/threonine PP2A family protein phosphatase